MDAMAIGIVFIAVGFQPVIQLRHRTIALAYVVFRAVECVLLLVGPILYLTLAGLIGYVFLLASALLAITGAIDTDGSGALLYIPGGLWEIIALPVWLYRHGFDLGPDRTVGP